MIFFGDFGTIVGVEGSPHWIFDRCPGGTESLGILPVRSLGVLYVLSLWILI